jgi:hypothetical protein
MKRSWSFAWAPLFLAAVFSTLPALAQGACLNNALNGSYGVTGGGTVIGVGPIAFVAVFNFDGDGHLSGSFAQKVNGNNVQVTFTGVYSVDASCMVSVTNYISSGAVTTLTLVVVDGGNEFYLLNTVAPTATSSNVVSGLGKRVRR